MNDIQTQTELEPGVREEIVVYATQAIRDWTDTRCHISELSSALTKQFGISWEEAQAIVNEIWKTIPNLMIERGWIYKVVGTVWVQPYMEGGYIAGVTKTGRKWAYLTNGARYDLDTGAVEGRYISTQVYASEEAFLLEQDQRTKFQQFKKDFERLDYHDLTTDKIELARLNWQDWC